MKQLKNNSKVLKKFPSKKPSKNFELYIFLSTIIVIVFIGFLSNRISALEAKVSQLESNKAYTSSRYSNQSKVNELENQIDKLRNKVYDIEESGISNLKDSLNQNNKARWDKIYKGMTKASVKRALGEPDRRIDDDSRFSYWFYSESSDNEFLIFNFGAVDSWEGPN